MIADLSGRALVRLAHVPFDGPGERRDGDEVATVLPFDGGPAEQALRTQMVQVVPQVGGWVVLAPVTDRGEAIGLLEMVLPDEPAAATLEEIARTAHALAFVVIANRRHTDLYEWGQRTTSSRCPQRSSAGCCQRRSRARPARSPCPAGWNRPQASAGTPSITAWAATCCT